jgi:hypothetical protein
MNALDYINNSGRRVLKFFPPDSLLIDLHFILTQNKILTRHMPYLLLEKKISGNHIDAIRILDFHEEDGVVSLSVQELESKKKYLLSANMDYDGNMWNWCLADFIALTNKS